MERSTIIILIIVFILLSAGLLIKNSREGIVAYGPSDQVVFNTSELKVCCTYFENGEEKKCSILEKYDCFVCANKCDIN